MSPDLSICATIIIKKKLLRRTRKMDVKTRELLKLKNIIFIMLLSFLLGGCALGTTELVIGHNELNNVQNKKAGNLLVKKFTDSRKNTDYIGNKRNGFGMVLGHVGLHDGENLESILRVR
jgi:hypothetical protein